MSLYRQGDIWYVYFIHKGQRIRRSTHTSDREAAQEFHDRLKADLWRVERLGEKPKLSKTWEDATLEWLGKGTRDTSDLYRLKWISASLGPTTPIADVADRIEGVLDRRGGSPASRARCINLIIAILHGAEAKGWISKVPKIERPKKAKGRLRWLSATEWSRLQQELPPHLLPLARFSIATGLRRHNATHLEWSQVDMKRRVMWVYADQAKGGEPFGIPLNDDAMAVLESVKPSAPQRYVFPYNGKPITKAGSLAWTKALVRAGLCQVEQRNGKTPAYHPEITWHGLRHTWASWHVMNGTSLQELKELGAWKSLEMVQVYAHLAPTHLARVANNTRPVDTDHAIVTPYPEPPKPANPRGRAKVKA